MTVTQEFAETMMRAIFELSIWKNTFLVFALISPITGSVSHGQKVKLRSSTSDSLSSRIKNQAALMEAQKARVKSYAEAAKSYAEASRKISDAASSGQDLELQDFNAMWRKEQEANRRKWDQLEMRIESSRKPMVMENSRKVAVWERMIEGSLSKIRPAIRTGSLLNRIAEQIDAVSGLSASQSVSSLIARNLATLDDRTLRAINVSIASINGPVDTSLTSSMPTMMSRWPYLFRDERLRTHSYRVNRVAERLFDPKATSVQKYEIDREVQMAIKEATNAFYRIYPPAARRSISSLQSQRIHAAEAFLKELSRTLANLAESDVSAELNRPSFVQQYSPEHRNAATLIQYMMASGMEFGPASAGTELIYDRLFLQFRDLANQLNSAPSRDSITEPIVNLDLDAMVKDLGIPPNL